MLEKQMFGILHLQIFTCYIDHMSFFIKHIVLCYYIFMFYSISHHFILYFIVLL